MLRNTYFSGLSPHLRRYDESDEVQCLLNERVSILTDYLTNIKKQHDYQHIGLFFDSGESGRLFFECGTGGLIDPKLEIVLAEDIVFNEFYKRMVQLDVNMSIESIEQFQQIIVQYFTCPLISSDTWWSYWNEEEARMRDYFNNTATQEQLSAIFKTCANTDDYIYQVYNHVVGAYVYVLALTCCKKIESTIDRNEVIKLHHVLKFIASQSNFLNIPIDALIYQRRDSFRNVFHQELKSTLDLIVKYSNQVLENTRRAQQNKKYIKETASFLAKNVVGSINGSDFKLLGRDVVIICLELEDMFHSAKERLSQDERTLKYISNILFNVVKVHFDSNPEFLQFTDLIKPYVSNRYLKGLKELQSSYKAILELKINNHDTPQETLQTTEQATATTTQAVSTSDSTQTTTTATTTSGMPSDRGLPKKHSSIFKSKEEKGTHAESVENINEDKIVPTKRSKR